MQPLVPTTFRRIVRRLAAGLLLSCAAWYPVHAAAPQSFQGLSVEVVGKGRPLLMIPGLNSAGETWRGTCAALQADRVQCHIVQLPGFAGLPAATDASKDAWLADMRERLLAYVETRKLAHPVVIGHSLGGFLALDMASRRPELFDRVVIVDALPFFSAIQNPEATADTAKPMAQAMRARMLAQDEASYRAGVSASLKGLVREQSHLATLAEWGNASDRAVTSQALYEMATIDLRDQVAQIRTPTLVLGSWAAYAPFGATKESTAGIFKTQYAKLEGVRIEMSEGGYHFLQWDDPQWLQQQVRGFITAK